MFKQLGLIGCGLMGGSFALAMKEARLVQHVVGYSKSSQTTQRAKQLGVIDQAVGTAGMAVAGSDIVLIAVPVAATDATFKSIRELVNTSVLFMDVGSTKRDVVDAARRVLKERVGALVPAHPIAGKELAGVQHADALLYKDRQVILTPIEQTLPELVDKAREVWTALGARVRIMTPEAHDRLRGGQPLSRTCWPSPISLASCSRGRAKISSRWRGRASGISPASQPATRRSGAISSLPTAKKC